MTVKRFPANSPEDEQESMSAELEAAPPPDAPLEEERDEARKRWREAERAWEVLWEEKEQNRLAYEQARYASEAAERRVAELEAALASCVERLRRRRAALEGGVQ